MCKNVLEFRAWNHERFTKDLILRGNFDPQILPNSKKFWMSMQRVLLYIHFMVLLREFTHPKFLRFG